MSEITEQEIRDAIFEVLKEQNAKKEEIRKSGILTMSKMKITKDFSSKIVLEKTEEKLSRDIDNLTDKLYTTFYKLFFEGDLTWGAHQEEPHPPEFFITEKGQKELDNLS